MDPSDNASIEYLRPKTVPDGLVALATVIQITDIQVKLQITGGIICLVDRNNVSQVYSKSLEEAAASYNSAKQPPKLSQMFKRGQQYVCKVVERRSRKCYADAQDIIATLDPNNIQEDNLPKTLLAIPQVPLQCAVQSVEDHGYLMDIGFKGLTGFLKFDEAKAYCNKHNDGKNLFIGQVIRCCLKEVIDQESESRIVQLALNKETMKKSMFTQEKVSDVLLTERCILPGSRSFLTVMNIRKDGLLVNFVNEFAGFVSINHLKDVWHKPLENYKVSDRFECTVLYYNSITKMFCLSLRSESKFKQTLKHFIETYHIGKVIKKAKVAYLDGIKSVNFRVDNTYKAVANVRDALDGEVGTMNKDELYLALDSAFPDGSQHMCRIKSLNLADLMIVVSLRQEFLDLPYVSVEELEPADFIEATVKKYVKDGIVVTFGFNLRAIILTTDLHDYVSSKSYKRYPIGKTIKCRILKIDFDKQPARVYLTNKEQLMDQDLQVVDSYDRSFKGKSTYATINKIKQDGLIVELFNNVKGFIPRRFLSEVQIKNVSDLFNVGQVTSCVIYRADPIRFSMMLGVIPYEKIMQMKTKKKFLKTEFRINWSANLNSNFKSTPKRVDSNYSCSSDSGASDSDSSDSDNENEVGPVIKSRRQRGEEARIREEKLREIERQMLDPDRPPQSIFDFERLLLKTPNSADAWVKYSKFFLENVETEKARIVCRRALRTINFRMEKEKMKIWLHLIKIEARYGGMEKLRETIEEAAQTNDKMHLYRGCVKVLSNCDELDEADRLYELMLRMENKSSDVWLEYIQFNMEHRKDLEKARSLFNKAVKSLVKSELVPLKSRFAQLEFKYGDVERGKTLFESFLADNPKRSDLWRVYEGMMKKFGTRQSDSIEVREQNEQTLRRIAESIELVSRKRKKLKSCAVNSSNK